eukprot:3432072-Rhodomonas_salina.1
MFPPQTLHSSPQGQARFAQLQVHTPDPGPHWARGSRWECTATEPQLTAPRTTDRAGAPRGHAHAASESAVTCRCARDRSPSRSYRSRGLSGHVVSSHVVSRRESRCGRWTARGGSVAVG